MAKAPRPKPEQQKPIPFTLNGVDYLLDAMALSSTDERDLLAATALTIPRVMEMAGEGSLLAVQALVFLASRSAGNPRAKFDDYVVTMGDVVDIEFPDLDDDEIDDDPKQRGGD